MCVVVLNGGLLYSRIPQVLDPIFRILDNRYAKEPLALQGDTQKATSSQLQNLIATHCLSVSGVLLSGCSFEGRCCRIGPGQELIEAALGMAVDDAADPVGQVGPGLDSDELASLDQGRDHRPVRGPTV